MEVDVSSSVAVFWDIENCAPPNGMHGTTVEKRLRESLREYGPIRQIFAYAELHRFPELLRMELQRSGIHLIDTPKGKYEKDVADHMIITDMFLFALENRAPQRIVLISGDIDYAYTLARLRQRRYEVILILPPVGAHPILKEQADIILEWTDVMSHEKTSVLDSTEWPDVPSLKFDTLRNALEDLRTEGNEAPALEEIEVHLNSRYPAWRSSAGFKEIADYVKEAELSGWITTEVIEGRMRVRLVTDDEEEPVDIPDIEEDRFAPLQQVLKDAEEKNIPELELASIGLRLRALMSNPLEKLQVSQLKDYVEEAETAALVNIRRDGLQNYVSIAGKRPKVRPRGNKEEQEILNLLEQALESLKDDELKPSEKNLISRMRELKQGWNLYKSCFGSIPKLLQAAQEKRGIIVEANPPDYLIFPKRGKFTFIDSTDRTYDPFTAEQWNALKIFLIAHPDVVARGRYGLAQRLKKEEVPGLSGLSLGLLSHLVQLAVNKSWLVFQWNKISVSPALFE